MVSFIGTPGRKFDTAISDKELASVSLCIIDDTLCIIDDTLGIIDDTLGIIADTIWALVEGPHIRSGGYLPKRSLGHSVELDISASSMAMWSATLQRAITLFFENMHVSLN